MIKTTKVMYEKVNVVMLPTNEKATNIVKILKDTISYTTSENMPGGIYQHLYFTSDDEIKEGDWVYCNNGNIAKITPAFWSFKGKSIYKKIIATTDYFLQYHDKTPIGENINGLWKCLPQPPQSFIEHFVSEYNKGNVITEVMVEFNDKITEMPKPYKPYSEVQHLDDTLIINQDNTINIKTTINRFDSEVFVPPFRLGRKQKRAILDAKGREVIIMPHNSEKQAQMYCDYLNGG